jgi:hypothetical protein
MIEDTYWIKIALKNIYKMYDAGSSFSGTPWDFVVKEGSTPEEVQDQCWEQQRVLQKLEHANVIRIKVSENDMRRQQLEGYSRGLDVYGWQLNDVEIDSTPGIEGIKYYDRLIEITGLNYDRFNEYCEDLSFDPSSDKVKASLSFKARDLWLTVEGRRYQIGRLNYGKPAAIADYCVNKKPGQEVSIEELKRKSANITNIKQALKDSVLNVDGPLAPFISSSPTSITIQETCMLSDLELSRLRNLIETSDF